MFTQYKGPQFEVHNLPDARAAESDVGENPAGKLGDLLGQVSKNSRGEINGLIGDFERLREQLRIDGDRIQREIKEYQALSEQVMLLTKTISDGVEKVRASAYQQRTDT
jgi:methyl-accepting chemotaxis protein